MSTAALRITQDSMNPNAVQTIAGNIWTARSDARELAVKTGRQNAILACEGFFRVVRRNTADPELIVGVIG